MGKKIYTTSSCERKKKLTTMRLLCAYFILKCLEMRIKNGKKHWKRFQRNERRKKTKENTYTIEVLSNNRFFFTHEIVIHNHNTHCYKYSIRDFRFSWSSFIRSPSLSVCEKLSWKYFFFSRFCIPLHTLITTHNYQQ